MRAFVVKEGTEVYAINFKKSSSAILDKKVTNKEKMYFLEDIEIDPIGKVGVGPNDNVIGGRWAEQGFYGFKLPENSQGYEIMLVHGSDVDVY